MSVLSNPGYGWFMTIQQWWVEIPCNYYEVFITHFADDLGYYVQHAAEVSDGVRALTRHVDADEQYLVWLQYLSYLLQVIVLSMGPEISSAGSPHHHDVWMDVW